MNVSALLPLTYIFYMFTMCKLDGKNMEVMPRISIVRFPVVNQDNADFDVGFRHILKMSASNSLHYINFKTTEKQTTKFSSANFQKMLCPRYIFFPFSEFKD